MSLALENLTILIVEDLKPMQLLLSSILTSLGFQKPYIANNGVEGWEAFQRYNPDIVLSDWMMSPGDGLDLTRKIRTHVSSPNKMCPVILITGYSSLPRVNEARDAGVTEFLVKPFTATDISKRLTHVINTPRDFVHLREFFGPDRRRRKDDTYSGPRRRESETKDEKKKDNGTWDVTF